MAECEWVVGGGAGGTSFKLLSSLYSQSTTWDCLVFTIIGSANLLLSVYSTYSIMLFTVLLLSYRQRHNSGYSCTFFCKHIFKNSVDFYLLLEFPKCNRLENPFTVKGL